MARQGKRPGRRVLEGLYLQGGTHRDIAHQFGVCKTTVSKWMISYGIPGRSPGRRRGPPIDDAILRRIVPTSTTVAEVVRTLGLPETGGTHSRVKNRIQELGIDTTHFLGQRANSGLNHKGGHRRKAWGEILVKRSSGRRVKTPLLRRALLEMGCPHQCAQCGSGPSWRGSELVLEIHHANGNWLDDRSKNLQFLCPNCHSQTRAHRGRIGT